MNEVPPPNLILREFRQEDDTMNDTFHIKGFIPTSFLDWPGTLCSVIFLGGCGFRCPACHNHKLVLEPRSFPDFPLGEILRSLDARGNWIDGITVTGGEPTIHQTLPDLLRIFRNRKLKIKLDTNGSNPKMLEALINLGLIDAVSMDIKAPLTSEEYSRAAGVPIDLDLITRSIDILRCSDLQVTFRTTAIPGLVEEPQLERITRALGNVKRYIVQAFRNIDTLNHDFGRVEEFGQGRIERMRELFEIPSSMPLNGQHALAG
ncbi:MAG: anaerobic ribonucleoside-triphosphate reductase activating protein [Desulfomonilaceae bacterium]